MGGSPSRVTIAFAGNASANSRAVDSGSASSEGRVVTIADLRWRVRDRPPGDGMSREDPSAGARPAKPIRTWGLVRADALLADCRAREGPRRCHVCLCNGVRPEVGAGGLPRRLSATAHHDSAGCSNERNARASLPCKPSLSAATLDQPWTEEMIAVCRKHENVYIDTSAYIPRRFPPELVSYMGGRGGRHEVLFGTSFPMIGLSQALEGLDDLGLDGEARELFLHGNAERQLGI